VFIDRCPLERMDAHWSSRGTRLTRGGDSPWLPNDLQAVQAGVLTFQEETRQQWRRRFILLRNHKSLVLEKLGTLGYTPLVQIYVLTSVNLPASPGTIPHFFKRCAMTRDLLDLVIELRPLHTSMGLAESIKRESMSSDGAQLRC
jgi:hypothetical protein